MYHISERVSGHVQAGVPNTKLYYMAKKSILSNFCPYGLIFGNMICYWSKSAKMRQKKSLKFYLGNI